MNIKPSLPVGKWAMLTAMLIALSSSLMAQQKDSTVYPVVIQFNSMCCGVPADGPLRSFISSFRKNYSIKKKISAWHIGPMGKEGEYWLAFPLKELTKTQAMKFCIKIQEIMPKLNDKGSASFNENMSINKSDLSPRATFEKVLF